MKKVYTTRVTAMGGRNGRVQSEDGILIGRIDNGVMGLAVTLEIAVPGFAIAKAENLVQKAKQVCPFSLTTKGNIEIQYLVSS